MFHAEAKRNVSLSTLELYYSSLYTLSQKKDTNLKRDSSKL